MEDIEQQEPIFELATECENLYAAQISRLNDDGDQNAAKLLSDIYQRFSAWAAFLGVFAEANVCLDRRLRRHIEIQDQVLRLLDIMQRNLSYLFEDSDSSKRGNIDPSEKDVRLSQPATVNIKSLDAISGALERLNQLGTAIRRSSVTSQTSKAREFAANFDLTSFEQVVNVLLRTLYSDASDGLIELLTRSMAESYALFLHRKSRQERLQVTRPVPRSQPRLTLIPEEPTGASDGSNAVGIDLEALRVSDSLTDNVPRAPPSRPVYRVPQSVPTSVDSQELKARLQTLMSPTAKTKPVSILVNQAEYPRPPKESLICEWCFSPLTTESREKSKWQEHLNEDFKPYICLSEKCAESMPRFASSRQWHQHMVTTHGENWHREVHAPASWVCPLCTELEASFHSPEGLSAHFDGCHIGIFKEQQMKAIVRQSIFRVPRSQETCPLCCFPMSDEQAPQANQEGTIKSNQQAKQYMAKPDDSQSKRFKTDTGYTEMRDNTNPDVDEMIMPGRESEVTDNSVSRNWLGTKVIGSHVAAHLQNVMLLTLRLISIDGAAETSTGSQFGSSETDYQASWVSSGPRGLDQEVSDIGRDLSPQSDGNIDLDNRAHSTEHVPDSEPINWDDVLGISLDMSGDGHVPASAVEPLTEPPASIEENNETQDSDLPYIIKELVDSEYTFGRDMEVVEDIYKGTTDSCPDISRNDIRIIFRNSDKVTQLSLDFRNHLREAASSVYGMPISQRRSIRRTGISHTPFTNDEQPGSPTVLQADKDRSTSIGQAFMTYSARMKEVYVEYLKKHDSADERLRALEKMPRVFIWLKECQKWASDLTNASDLHELLARPIHRMSNYAQILETLLSFTPTDHPDRQPLAAALKEVTKINITANEAKKQQALVREVLNQNNQTGFLRALNWRTRKGSTVSGTDTEYAALAERFGDNVLHLQIVMRDIVLFMDNFSQPIDSFMEIIATIEEFIDVCPTSYPRLEGKWRELNISAQDIKSTMVPEHLVLVQRCVIDPLAQLLKLHEGPQRSMKSRNNYLSDYTNFMAVRERGEKPGKRMTEQAQIFMALNETLKDELPKLYSLTEKLVRACLHNLVQIQATCFILMEKELWALIDSFPDERAPSFNFCEAQILSLGICNGSLLVDTTVTHHASFSTREPSINSNSPAANTSSITPTLPRMTLDSSFSDNFDPPSSEGPKPPPVAGRVKIELAGTNLGGAKPEVLFLAASLYEFNMDRDTGDAGYPYLTYVAGETFEVVATKGDLWLARNQEDPTHQLGWLWRQHFANLSS